MRYTEQRTMFTVTLTPEAFRIARKFQSQYDEPEKARQVYLNILAVYAVDFYCDCMGIETDLEASDSLDIITQSLMDVADLELTNLGKLECRPVLPKEPTCYIPSDTWENRIGYVAVGINEEDRQATLIGFYPAVNPLEMTEQVSLDDFQSLSSLLDHLSRLETAIKFFFSNDEVAVKVRERLDSEPISEIAAQLDRIYRTYDKNDWKYAVRDLLASYLTSQKGWRGATTVLDREEFDESQQREFRDLAEELLEKLGEIWSEDEPEEEDITDTPTPTPKTTPSQQPAIVSATVAPIEGLVNLSECLQNPQNLPKYSFQTLESYLRNRDEIQAFRFATAPRSRRAETENALMSMTGVREIQLAEHLLALMLGCQQDSANSRNDILVRLYPTGNNTYLPPGVQMIVLDESGDIFLEAQARRADNWIQLEFRGEPGERFSIKLALAEASITQNFAI